MEKLLIEDYAGTSSDDINYQSLFQEFWVVKLVNVKILAH